MSSAAAGTLGKGHIQVGRLTYAVVAPRALSCASAAMAGCVKLVCYGVYQLESSPRVPAAHPGANVLWKIVSPPRPPSALYSVLTLSPLPFPSRTELIRRMRRFQVANQACLMIKYAKDTRYDQSGVATHDRSATPLCPSSPPPPPHWACCVMKPLHVCMCVCGSCTCRQVTSAVSATELTAMTNTAKKYGVIGIDEGQFVSPCYAI